jgi:hypothetical protein
MPSRLPAVLAVVVGLLALTVPAAGASTGPGAAKAKPGAPGSLTGYGFDACSAPPQAVMDAWWEQSPYSAVSAMAIDPIYLDVTAVPEFIAAGGVAAFDTQERDELDGLRNAPSIEYGMIRRLKERALRIATERFVDSEIRRGTARAQSFARFLSEQGWWLQDYALFRAIHAHEDERPWTSWPNGLKRREQPALADAKYALASEVMFRQYVQWLAHTQWADARAAANRKGIALFAADYPHDYPEVEATVMCVKHKLRLAEVPVRMRERSGGQSSITAFRSVYYMAKVLLAIFVGLFRRYAGPEEDHHR